ncbi:hypothetical protein TL16_g00876 [Triparma laevis f. inornata]|uniref:Protein kinase domain-containing protein n=1 Tax=Triparma laevis f. inornata TaxID=1714386 RepID=A0A9W6ZAW9_9STRA|nr:hypothetical protein TL16_g00876 [Triparma laevis f. inornata]
MPVGLVSPLPNDPLAAPTPPPAPTPTLKTFPPFDVLQVVKVTPSSKISLVLPRATFTPVILKTSVDGASNGVILQELKLLKTFDHPSIIKPLQLSQPPQPHLPLLFLPYLQPLPSSTLPHHFTSILSALHHIHSKGYIHADVKPSNILSQHPNPNSNSPLGHDFKLILTDFSHTKPLNHKSATLYTTPTFSLPAYSGTYTPSIDFYALKTSLNLLFKFCNLTDHKLKYIEEFIQGQGFSNPYPVKGYKVQEYVEENFRVRKSMAESVGTKVFRYNNNFGRLPQGTFYVNGEYTVTIKKDFVYILNSKMFVFGGKGWLVRGRVLREFFGIRIEGEVEGVGWATNDRLEIRFGEDLVEYNEEGCFVNGKEAGEKWWDFCLRVCERRLEERWGGQQQQQQQQQHQRQNINPSGSYVEVEEEEEEEQNNANNVPLNLDVTVDSFLFESEDDQTVSSLGDLVVGVEEVVVQEVEEVVAEDIIFVNYDNKKVHINAEVYGIVKGRAVAVGEGGGGEEGKAIRAWVEEMRRRRTFDDSDSDELT